MTDHDAALLGHETDPAVVSQALPHLRDVVAVPGAVGPEGGRDHPSYSGMVVRLLGAHLETHARHAAMALYGSAMEIASLANRTDLAMLERSGSEITDRGTHLVVRTPDNPTFWWGNFLLLADAPTDEGAAAAWLREFEREFPDARHRTFGTDRTDGAVDDLAAFTAIGLDVEASSVMTAQAVHEPPRPNTEATYRPLASDDDWAQQIEVARAGEEIGYDLPFVTAKTRAERRLVDGGYGAWWGAFEGDRLLASMGLFTASDGLARFQNVKTHPDTRGRGLAGTLVHRVSRYGFEELGARTLVMVADPDYLAIRIYRSVGFAETERQLQAERKPADS
jgi:ribosomal protein S18 acetylase RimI-like enzyme